MNTITPTITDQDLMTAMWESKRGWMERAGIDTEGMPYDHALMYHLLPYARAVLALAEQKQAAKVAELQARIDALMLEHCPDEMTPEQVAEWAKHQRPAEEAAQPAQPVGIMSRATYSTSSGAGYKQISFQFAELHDANQVLLWAKSCGAAPKPAQVAAPTQADGWQPIETAPKDGQLCAVHAPGAMVCDVWPARWNAECRNFEAGGGWFEPDEVVSWIVLPEPAPKREAATEADARQLVERAALFGAEPTLYQQVLRDGLRAHSDAVYAALRDREAAIERARADALEEAAKLADSKGHHWSGAPALAFFDLAEDIRALGTTGEQG